ncbi:MAG: YdeI/OmpD-associated family protein [Bacteroidia bacterium]
MPKKDPRVDAYIAKAQPFAQPVLKHLRKLIHQACPDVQETIKWGFASFDYKGPFVSFASFKQHCVLGFWKAALMKDGKKLKENQEDAMGHLGRITGMKDLPSDKKLIGYIKEAMKLNDEGVKLPPRKKVTEKTALPEPAFLKAAIGKNKKAKEQWAAFTPGKKKEYITWVTEAKTTETRDARVKQSVEWIGEGKIRNWKYVK